MNSKLQPNVYTIPPKVLNVIRHTITGLNGENAKGKKRAEKLLSDGKVKYGQLKRIIHDLSTMDKVNEKVRYNLYGGAQMEDWASTFLNGERQLVRDKKDASASINNNTGLQRKNAHLKTHTKKPQGINLGIKSNSEKSVASALFEEINRMKKIINY